MNEFDIDALSKQAREKAAEQFSKEFKENNDKYGWPGQYGPNYQSMINFVESYTKELIKSVINETAKDRN
ncbi:MAG: hypothetical protein ABF608_07205 [Sporolactobacillus sp.]